MIKKLVELPSIVDKWSVSLSVFAFRKNVWIAQKQEQR